MVTNEIAKEIALLLPETEEQDHWGRPSFRIRKKIFATLWPDERRMVLKLSLVDQSVFVSMDAKIFYPVEGGWGRQGYTNVDLKKVKKEILKEALATAWRQVATKAMIAKYFPGN